MQISFHGAARTVTGSRHLIEANGHRVLLDCGIYHGRRQEAFERNRNFSFEPSSIDAVILSHAHIDHSGNLPLLVKNGFDGPIYTTHATRDLCASMLPDSGHIHEKDAEYLNKKHKRQGKPLIEPLYTQNDAYVSLHYLESINYHRAKEIMEGIYFTFYDAGHILGSSFVVLDIEDRDAGRDIRLVFSGDLGREGLPLIRDPETVDHADLLIMESTYGGRLHEPIPDTAQRLKEIVNKIYQNKGVLIIPAFAVGRTQQLVYELQKLHSKDEIPELPIYVDSPLAINITSVFRQHPEIFDRETHQYMRQFNDEDVFGFSKLQYTRRVEESIELNTMDPPFIVISASGMAEHGRILHHLKHHIEDPHSVVLIVGWQAPNTLGRKLVEGASKVRILGREYKVRASVEKLNGLSGHADSNELVDWVAAMEKRPQKTFLVHGELDAAQSLAKSLSEKLELEDVVVPEMHQQFDWPPLT